MLRPLETQQHGENGTITVSDTQYDTHGWVVLTNNAYSTAGNPGKTLISDHLSQVSIPDTTVSDHDALGHVTQTTAEHNGAATWHTRTAYQGDRVTSVPPAGGVATTTTTDARGQTSKLEQYTVQPTLSGSVTAGFTAAGGTSQPIAYEYTPLGKQSKVTGPDNAAWTFGYDLRGRLTSHGDPDTGSNVIRYDDADQAVAVRDARGIELDYTYDLLGRKLTATDKSKSGFQYASWAYDTVRIGKPTSSTRYVNGVTGNYTTAVTGYSALGNPLGTKITLPTVEKPLPTEYTTTFAYTANTEQVARQTDPAVTGMAGETITYGYDGLGAPSTTTGIDQYVSGTNYGDFGKPSRITMGSSATQAEQLLTYDEHTLRLTGRQVYRSQGIGPLVDDIKYTYDDAGNPLTAVDKQSESGNVVTDAQCYRYNTLDRLVEAKTVDGDCSTGTVANRAGSYWQNYAYDPIGDRTETVDHATNGGTDVTTTYTNGCTTGCNRTGSQPHTLTATKGGADPTSLVYDVDGNLLTRTPTKAAGQALKWDDEGRLAEVAAGTDTTAYLYDADGNQLIRRDPGRTTLFAGDTEVVINTAVNPAATLGAVRTYTHGGLGVAVRSSLPGGGTSYLFTDPLGTGTMAMDVTTHEVSRKQYKPYGEDRGTVATTAWPDLTHGYLGKPVEASTGYTDLGARKYDPVLGRFISADPVLETADPNQLGGYTYAGDNPVATSDPTGLRVDGDRPGCAPGNGGMCGGYVGPDVVPASERGNGGGGKGHSREGSDGGSGGTDLGYTVTCGRGACTKHSKTPQKYCGRGSCAYSMPDDQVVPTGGCHANCGKYCVEDADYHCLKSGLWAGLMVLTTVFDVGVDVLLLFGGEEFEAPAVALETRILKAEADEAAEAEAAAAAANASKPRKLTCSSFVPTTLVLMSDGSTKPIGDVVPGDVVRTTDPETGITSDRTVTAQLINHDEDLADLIVTDADGRRTTIHTTASHLFFDRTRDDWVEVIDLVPGDRLATDGAEVSVAAVVPLIGVRDMYNLTVDGVHTYYVLAGATPVLVHNEGDEDTGPSAADKRFARQVNLSPTDPAVANRGMKVTDFIAKYRKGGVRSVIGKDYMEMTVGDALKTAKSSHDSQARKMLVDGRFAINSNYRGKIC
ncbi:RHS repeat-associated core domain-containing protein [Paractinoplanes durhamensis]